MLSSQHPTEQLRFIIAGGGTGGHIFPAVAIANALKAKSASANILFVGAKGKMEMEKIPQAGYEIVGLDIAGFNRTSIFKNITLPFKLVKSFLQVRRIFRRFKPHAVIGVGGYSSFPVLRFAQSQNIPTFIHESNSFAGKTNILLGKKATKIFVAGPGMDKFFPAEKLVIAGNPVRQNIADARVSKEEACRYFGLSGDKKTVLIIGGSLGAASINAAIDGHLHHLVSHDLQVIWQTGKTETSPLSDNYRGIVWKGEFIKDMHLAYAAADVVVSRSGAMAVTEITVTRKPAVFVPYPYAAEDHQTVNARFLVDRNAALMVNDKDASTKLRSVVLELVKNEELQQTFKTNMAALAKVDADEVIANNILTTIQ